MTEDLLRAVVTKDKALSDGRTLVTSRFQSGRVTLWDAATGKERMTLPAHATCPTPVAAIWC